MTTLLILAFIVGVFLVGLALGRLHGTEQQVERMQHELDETRQLLVGRRVPYRVVEDVENEQARIVNDLLNAEEALDRVRAAMGRTINIYGRLLDREPLEGNGRDRHKISRR
jgi:hypothetical protein